MKFGAGIGCCAATLTAARAEATQKPSATTKLFRIPILLTLVRQRTGAE
jgi:hypothetical protein